MGGGWCSPWGSVPHTAPLLLLEHGREVPGWGAAPGCLHRYLPKPAQAGTHTQGQDRQAAGTGAEGPETRPGPCASPAARARCPVALPSPGRWWGPLGPASASATPAAPRASWPPGHAFPGRCGLTLPWTPVPAAASPCGPAPSAGLLSAPRVSAPARAAPEAPTQARLHSLGALQELGTARIGGQGKVWRWVCRPHTQPVLTLHQTPGSSLQWGPSVELLLGRRISVTRPSPPPPVSGSHSHSRVCNSLQSPEPHQVVFFFYIGETFFDPRLGPFRERQEMHICPEQLGRWVLSARLPVP